MSIIHQRDAQWWFKLNGASRLAIARGGLNAFAKPVVLTEYPKSGGTWLSQMLSAALGIPYPRNRLPHLGSQIIHGCYLNTGSKVDTIVAWRDGRDTMVSFYYHLMFEKPITSARYSRKVREMLDIGDPHDIQARLPEFIEWTFTGGYPGYSWSDFVNNWYARDGMITTSYERVSADPLAELKRVLQALGRPMPDDETLARIVEEYSFENQSSRKKGEEDVTSFVRKGIVGDWKNVFDRRSREVFHRFGGKELIALGYEKDDAWVDDPEMSLNGLPGGE